MLSKEDILKKGSVDVHVLVGGIRQRHTLKVEEEKTAWGMVPFCVFTHQVPASELIRVSQELGLPVKCRGMKVFPKGKGAKDFAKVESAPKPKGLAHSRIIESSVSSSESEEDESDEEEPEETDEEESKDEVEEDSAEEETEEDETEKETESEEETEGEEETEEESDQEPVEDDEPDGKAPEPEEEEEEEEWGEKQPEGEEGPHKPEPQKEEIEIEGSMDANQQKIDPEKKDDPPKKKAFTGILSEGILS